MHQVWVFIATAIALSVSLARAETAPSRPDLSSAKPIATCNLQAIGERSNAANMRVAGAVYPMQAPVEEPLANYERSELGNWRMPADAELSDPWIRLLVVGPKRPLVIDLAVFIDGKTFRAAREAWIDDMLASGESAPKSPDDSDASTEKKPLKTAKDDPQATAAAVTSIAVKDDTKGDEKNEKDEKTPGVAAQSRQAPVMRERLMNYVAASGSTVERDEIRWLIAEWGSGPGLVVLGPALSWQRAGVATLETLLDGDADGAISALEITQAAEILNRADLDANEVVEMSEIRRANRRESEFPYAMGHSMVVILDGNTDWESLGATLQEVYARKTVETPPFPSGSTSTIQERIARGDATLNVAELHKLQEEPADVSLRVDFASSDNAPSSLSVLAAAPEFVEAKDAVSVTENVITIDLGSDYLEISAARESGGLKAPAAESQIAVGAVIDGNPLLRVLDRDQDQRLTQRERHELIGLLASLDRDADGTLSAAEIPIPIRFAVTLGPHVHTVLAKPTGAARAIAPRDEAAPPDWFASMDQNGDRDLSREEFLGTTAQFKQFDADGDGLLNIDEALKLDAGQ